MKILSLIIFSVSLGFIVGYNVAPSSSQNASEKVSDLTPPITNKSNMVPFFDKNTEEAQNRDDRENQLRKIQERLTKASNKISDLEKYNKALALQIEQMNLPMSSDTSYPGLLEKIDRLPESFVKSQLENLFNKDAIKNINDVKAFSKRLVEVALDENEINEDQAVLNISFSLSPVNGQQPIDHQAVINKFDTVFAHIITSQPISELLVKWQNINTGEIVLFKKHTQSSIDQHFYVAHRPNNGWSPGAYRVSLHTMDDSVNILGSNSYTIA
ncbi:hypothetical protein [Kaarinaea lacus]